ncbi:outer membrane protein assembly factor BamB [Thalassolituus sp. LLYu03]|uniref:outer membrane protein assembly factor BamB n=1 Tax=Thalassolituus sp. LLYu03 TaxID=3421656 RepID=UPI003D285192
MRHLLVPVLLTAFLAGCASSPESTDSGDEGSLPALNRQTDISIEWRTSLGTGPGGRYTRLRPDVADGVVYMADVTGHVAALALDGGDEAWSIDLGLPVTGGVSEDNGQLFVATMDGLLHCLNASNGEEIWASQMTSESVAPVGLDRSRVFVHTVDGRVTAFERSNGRQAWSYETAMPVLTVRGTATPLVLDQLVITGFSTGKLVALDKVLGVPRWDVRLAIPDGRSELERLVDVDGSAMEDSGVVYAASYHGKLAAVDLSGQTRWEEDGSTYTSPAMGLGNLYLTLDDDTVQAFDQISGAKVWTQKGLKGRRLSQVVAYGRWLLATDGEGYLHVMNQVDGDLVGRKLLRPNPLHVNYPNQTEGANWKALRGRDLGVRSPVVTTDNGVLVYTNAGELMLLSIEAD